MLKEIGILEIMPTTELVDMYDIEVEDNHNYFLGNGFLTHNSLNLLKSATESQEVRLLTKSNFSRQQENLPDYFVCKCKFIFDYNNLFGLQLKQDFEALVTRGDYKEMPFSDDDVKNILRLIAKGDSKSEEVTEFLISKFESNGIIKLNLRTQWKALRTKEYAEKNGLDWKKELSSELDNVSKIRALLYTLIGTKAIRTADLKRLLMKNEIANTVRTSHRMVADWLFLEELHKVSEEQKDFFVCINDFSAKKIDNPESCPA